MVVTVKNLNSRKKATTPLNIGLNEARRLVKSGDSPISRYSLIKIKLTRYSLKIVTETLVKYLKKPLICPVR